LGVLLAAIGACCLALAMSVQRYGLTTPPPVPFLGFKLAQFWVWFSGLLIYWVANGLFALSLIYAPLALLGAIFTTLLVWNLLFGRLLLGEKITYTKAAGAVVIMVGVALIAIATPSDIPTDYSVHQAEGYLNDTNGAIYLSIIITIVVICVVAIAIFEHKYPLPKQDDEIPLMEIDSKTMSSHLKSATTLPIEDVTSAQSPKDPVHSIKKSRVRSIRHSKVRGRSRTMTRSIAFTIKRKNTEFITNALMRNHGLHLVEEFDPDSPQGNSHSGEGPTGLMVNISKEIMIVSLRERNQNTPLWLEKLMGVVYPGSLGLDEGIGHLAMKAFMALFSTCGDNDECGAPILWGMIMLWLVSSLATLWWLQTVFRRYDVTQALPIEYGAVMACDALSAIIFYKEDTFMEDWQFALTLVGVVVIIVGILVGRYQRGGNDL